MEAPGDDRHGQMGPVYTADRTPGREVIPRLSRGSGTRRWFEPP